MPPHCGNIVRIEMYQTRKFVNDKNLCRRRLINETEHFLCRLDELADGASKEVLLDDNHTSLCLVRRNDTVYAYVNSCPHTGAPLNWSPDQFLTIDGDMLQCAIHGALFRITDGQCVRGPCMHRRLTPIPTITRDGVIFLVSQNEQP